MAIYDQLQLVQIDLPGVPELGWQIAVHHCLHTSQVALITAYLQMQPIRSLLPAQGTGDSVVLEARALLVRCVELHDLIVQGPV